MLRRTLLPLAAAALLVAALASTAAAEPYVPIAGYHAPGTPARYDRVFVTKTGPASAHRVLVLVPGLPGRRRRLHPDRARAGAADAGPAGVGGGPPLQRLRGRLA